MGSQLKEFPDGGIARAVHPTHRFVLRKSPDDLRCRTALLPHIVVFSATHSSTEWLPRDITFPVLLPLGFTSSLSLHALPSSQSLPRTLLCPQQRPPFSAASTEVLASRSASFLLGALNESSTLRHSYSPTQHLSWYIAD